jgi:hypothetical protein
LETVTPISDEDATAAAVPAAGGEAASNTSAMFRLRSRIAPVSKDVPGSTLTFNPEGVADTVMVEQTFSSDDPRHAQQTLAMLGGGGGASRSSSSGDNATFQLQLGNTTGRCLSAAVASKSSVFGRSMGAGAWALLFINWDDTNQGTRACVVVVVVVVCVYVCARACVFVCLPVCLSVCSFVCLCVCV